MAVLLVLVGGRTLPASARSVAGRRYRAEDPAVERSQAALVTGCSSGMGRAIASRLAGAGWTVYATARRRSALADLAAVGCRTLALDVTDAEQAAAAVAAVEAEHGAVGVLVNNAGYGQQGPFEETDLARVRQQFEVNVFGPTRLCQLILPGMRAQRWGRIVNVTSMGGRITFPGGAAYHGSKYAMEAMSDVLRFEVAPFGIDVVVVEPGPTLTPWGEAALATLDGVPDAGPYATLTASIRAALEATFHGDGLPGASTAEDVADAVLQAGTASPPPTRVVGGGMAAQLIELRRTSSDEQWDALMETMYQRPTPT
jgi:NAD(P)-dependent dehydrogenase (short-subunit alcohol dehydrogenase family)